MSELFSDVDRQSDGQLAIRELLFATQLTLRLDPGGAAAAAVAAELGQPLPTLPNTLVSEDGLEALWTGPDEWLLVSFARTPAELEAAIRARLVAEGAGDAISLVDVSAQRTIVELSGPAARSVLSRGCAIDLHESVFRAGHCAQTLLAQSPLTLQPLAGTDAVRIFVRASFAHHLAAWLLDASMEERTGAARALAGEPASLAR
ncbi:MAG: sarcosine oxidase subunit gamma [Actinomycetota bacterium]|nr:sarcosine oxidase subunit gamma [Actinomycetota bacterium]